MSNKTKGWLMPLPFVGIVLLLIANSNGWGVVLFYIFVMLTFLFGVYLYVLLDDMNE